MGVLAAVAMRSRKVGSRKESLLRDNYELAFPLLRKYGLSATFFLASGFLDGRRVSWWDEIAWMAHRAGSEARHVAAVPGGVTPPTGSSLLPTGISFTASSRDATVAELVDRYKALPDGDGERFLEEFAEVSGSGRCGASNAEGLWMSWEMAREMRDAGMSIGGHTVSHPVLARLSVERQREEIAGCAQRLSEELGVAMRWFAYPVGSRGTFTPLTRMILRDCGVELAFSFYAAP